MKKIKILIKSIIAIGIITSFLTIIDPTYDFSTVESTSNVIAAWLEGFMYLVGCLSIAAVLYLLSKIVSLLENNK